MSDFLSSQKSQTSHSTNIFAHSTKCILLQILSLSFLKGLKLLSLIKKPRRIKETRMSDGEKNIKINKRGGWNNSGGLNLLENVEGIFT